MAKQKTTAQMFREAADAVPASQAKKARADADELVEKMTEECIEKARKAAVECGYHSTTAHLARPMVSSNLVPERDMIEELVGALEREGFEVTFKIDSEYNSNIPKLYVTMKW